MTASISLIIAIDGPSGCGKSTASHRLAAHFDIPCIDTGAMYRTLALRALEQKLDLTDEKKIVALAERLRFRFGRARSGEEGQEFYTESSLDGGAFVRMDQEIRTPEVSMGASQVAKQPEVRKVLVRLQQEVGRTSGGVIEGRDAGTVIFPSAPLKFYLTGTSAVRAQRRAEELKEKMGDQAPSYAEILRDTEARDAQDANRTNSPMKPAADAILVDTTEMSLEEVVKFLIDRVGAYRGLK